MLGASGSSVPSAGSQPEEPSSRKKDTVANGHVPYSRTLSHISEASVDATMEVKTVESPWEPAPSTEDTGMGKQDAHPLPGAAVAAAVAGQDRAIEAKPRASVAWATSCEEEAGSAEPVQSQAPAQSDYGTGIPTALAQASAEEAPIPTPPLPTSVPEVPRGKMVDSGLEEAIGLLGSALDDYRGQFPELQPLERELKRLEEMLLVRGSQGCHGVRVTGLSWLAVPGYDGDRGSHGGSAQRPWRQYHPCWQCPGMVGMGPTLLPVSLADGDGAIHVGNVGGRVVLAGEPGSISTMPSSTAEARCLPQPGLQHQPDSGARAGELQLPQHLGHGGFRRL